jgi:hypothetical protein
MWKYIIVVLLTLSPCYALSDEAKGLVVASKGSVVVEVDQDIRDLKQGDEVFITDRIITNTKSFVVIQFLDGTKVTIKPNSELIIREYIYNSTSEDKATLSLVSGGLRIVTGAITKENYRLETPVALMGVRGTEFSVQLCGNEICQQTFIE